MGNGHSQQEEDEAQSSKVFDTRCISFDEDGNLRLGEQPPPLFCCKRRLVMSEKARTYDLLF
jgi:hypothetical protein